MHRQRPVCTPPSKRETRGEDDGGKSSKDGYSKKHEDKPTRRDEDEAPRRPSARKADAKSKYGAEQEHEDERSYGYAGPPKPSSSGWKTRKFRAIVSVSVEVVTASAGFPKRIAIREEDVNITASEIQTPDATVMRSYSIRVSDIAKQLLDDYVEYTSFVRLPDKYQPVGKLGEICKGKGDINIQIFPSLGHDNVYEAALFLSKGGKDMAALQDKSPMFKSGPPKTIPKPGPMDYHDEDNSDAASDATFRPKSESGRKSSSKPPLATSRRRDHDGEAPSRRRDHGHTETPIHRRDHEDIEVIGHNINMKDRNDQQSSDGEEHAKVSQGYEDSDDERHDNGFAAARRGSSDDVHFDEDEDRYEDDEGRGGTRDLATKSKAAPKPKSAFRTAQRFSANRPWAGAIVAPTNAPPLRGDLPEENLTLEYVHGNITRDSRHY
ncbi:hypothetical protein HK101_012029 [Irineochytrium annulatum]|nr:hypothetical protein HK101_012029 [Irineochytrium annulatum]